MFASNGAGHDAMDSDDLHRKLLASQERQAIILKKIQEKEKKLDLNNQSAATAPTPQHGTSFASAYPTNIHNLSTASMALGLSPNRDPYGQQSLTLANMSSSFSASTSATSHQQLVTQEEKYQPTSNTPASFIFSVHDELNHTGVEDESAILRLRQLSSQLRQCRSENARKDILLTNLQQQNSELHRQSIEYTSARGAWDNQTQQWLLQRNEYESNINDLHITIQNLTMTEENLRKQLHQATNLKLGVERDTTVQLGEFDALVHNLRTELEKKSVSEQQAQYELSLATREVERVTNLNRAVETQHLTIQQEMENKYFTLKAAHQALEDEVKHLRTTNGRFSQEVSERTEQLDARDTEIMIYQRSKASQQALIDSLTRELAELQMDRTNLKQQVDTIPMLRSECQGYAECKAELRQAQGEVTGLEEQVNSLNLTVASLQKDKDALTALSQQLESTLFDTRQRYQELIAPTGDLQTSKAQIIQLEDEVTKHQTDARTLMEELHASQQEVERLEKESEETNSWITIVMNDIHRKIESGVSGAGGDPGSEESESLPLVSPTKSSSKSPTRSPMASSLTAPATVKDTVRSAANNLQGGVKSYLSELRHLRTQQHSLIQQLNTTHEGSGRQIQQIAELESLCREQDLNRKHADENYQRALEQQTRQFEALELTKQNLMKELNDQKEDNTKLNQQNTHLIQELDERTVVIRLWAVELESIVRSLSTHLPSVTNTESDHTSDRGTLLGSSLSSALTEHWPSIRTVFGQIMFLLSEKLKNLTNELASCEKSRQQQRVDILRLTTDLETIAHDFKSTRDQAAEDRRQFTAALSESEQKRLSECQRLSDERNATCQALEESYQKIIGEVQATNLANTNELLDLTRRNQNLLTAVRLLYKGFKPIWTRLQELVNQKAILTKLYQMGLREHQQARELMINFTGNTNAPDGVRLLPHGKRALFRAGVIAVLAVRRFAFGPRRNNSYGSVVQIRGEQFSLLDNSQLSNDNNLPIVDDSSLSTSASSLVHLLAHFEPFADRPNQPLHLNPHQRSLLQRITAGSRFPRLTQAESDAASPIYFIRCVCLNLAARNKSLVSDLEMSHTEAVVKNEDTRHVIEELTNSHEKVLTLTKEELSKSHGRVETLTKELELSHQMVRRLEESLNTMTRERTMLIPIQEYNDVRLAREELASKVRELDSNLNSLQRTVQMEKESAALKYQMTIDGLEHQLSQSTERFRDLSEENTQLQLSLRRKSSEVQSHESSLKESADIHDELSKNLEMCMSKNQALVDRIRLLENEIQEHRSYSQRVKSSTQQYDISKQQWEVTYGHLQQELREKERELTKAQELIRTLTAATRVAMNELEHQPAFTQARLNAFQPSGARGGVGGRGSTPNFQPPPSTSYYPIPIHATSPYPLTQPQPSPQVPLAASTTSSLPPYPSSSPDSVTSGGGVSSPNTIHLRHHPGGRLSMDVTSSAMANGFSHGAGETDANHFPSFQTTKHHSTITSSSSSSVGLNSSTASANQLRFDDLPTGSPTDPTSSSAPPSAYLYRQLYEATPQTNQK